MPGGGAADGQQLLERGDALPRAPCEHERDRDVRADLDPQGGVSSGLRRLCRSSEQRARPINFRAYALQPAGGREHCLRSEIAARLGRSERRVDRRGRDRPGRPERPDRLDRHRYPGRLAACEQATVGCCGDGAVERSSPLEVALPSSGAGAGKQEIGEGGA